MRKWELQGTSISSLHLEICVISIESTKLGVPVWGTEIEARRAIEEAIRIAGEKGLGWWVLNTIPLREKSNSDADVIVGIPNLGILILEVKGWVEFQVDDTGKWSRQGRDGTLVDAKDGPFVQAQRQEYLLKDRLERFRIDQKLESGPLPRIGSGVLFGNLTRKEVDASEWSNDLQFTIFGNEISLPQQPTVEDAVKILNILQAVLRANAIPDRSTDNRSERLKSVYRILAPTRRVKGLAAFVLDAHDTLDQLAETAMSSKAEVIGERILYVEGAAGTGKTVLALQLGLQRSRSSGRPSLYLCFSNNLSAEIRMIGGHDRDQLWVCTPEELLERVAGSTALEPFFSREAEAVEASRQVAELTGQDWQTNAEQPRSYLGSNTFWDTVVSSLANAGSEFAAILVDEAQDLWEPAFSYLSALASNESLFAVFVDPNQTTRRERAGLTWVRPESTIAGHSLQLKRNFRNGDRIIDAVEERFGIKYDRPPMGSAPAEVNLIPYSNADPMVVVVIRVESALRTAGLDPVVLTTGISAEDMNDFAAAGLQIHSVDSFKGLERKTVILVLGRQRSPIDPNDEDLYVGMTRASVLLTIIHHSSQAPLDLGTS